MGSFRVTICGTSGMAYEVDLDMEEGSGEHVERGAAYAAMQELIAEQKLGSARISASERFPASALNEATVVRL